MKTIIHIVLSEEERESVYMSLFGHPGKVSRKQLTRFVEDIVCEVIKGNTIEPASIFVEDIVGEVIQGNTIEPASSRPVKAADEVEPAAPASGDRGIHEFVPTRGDEAYMYKGKDPELAAQCSKVLDGIQYIEQYAWTALERNRE